MLTVMNIRSVIVELICFLFIGLFMYAALSKLLDNEKFTVQILQSPLLAPFAFWITWMIPGVEILCSIFLMIYRLRLIALYAALTLMVTFYSLHSGYFIFSDKIPCSCGGILESLGWREHLVFNVTFVLLSVLAIYLVDSSSKPDSRLIA